MNSSVFEKSSRTFYCALYLIGFSAVFFCFVSYVHSQDTRSTISFMSYINIWFAPATRVREANHIDKFANLREDSNNNSNYHNLKQKQQ